MAINKGIVGIGDAGGAIVPSDNFNTVLYTGNDGTQAITGVGFEPDFTWIKQRSGGASHSLQDSVRGAGQSKNLYSDNTAAEGTYGQFGYLSAFGIDGFTVVKGSGSHTNAGSSTYVAWNWKAGGAAVSNTDGTITSQVSANVDAGFSIVSQVASTGSWTVGHGLDVAPEIVFYKNLDVSNAWGVWVTGFTDRDTLYLNLTNAKTSVGSGTLYGSVPTSTTIGTSSWLANSGDGVIAYCFHSVDGFSKIGSYVGNNPTSSTVRDIYIGFRPAFVMIKNTTTAGPGWNIYDDKRPNATSGSNIFANNSNAEADYSTLFEMTSTGFKLKSVNTNTNYSTDNFIFMAFAEDE